MTAIRLILWLGAALSIPSAEPLRTGCEADAQEVAQVTPADDLRVVSAIAGGDQTCYEIVLRRDGKEITGYALGEGLPAVETFVRQREKAAVSSFAGQDQWAHLAATRAKSVIATTRMPDTGAVFADFSGRDTTGKSISLSGQGGRVTLVTFWSPRSPASVNQLASLIPVVNQYKHSGLRAIGISADPKASHAVDALDDITLGWPQIPDGAGLAKKYGADPKAGTTLVLDSDHHIVAAGLTGPELEQKVRELLQKP